MLRAARWLRVPHLPHGTSTPSGLAPVSLLPAQNNLKEVARLQASRHVSGKCIGSQVICAGVWHNVVMCACCWAAAAALPALLAPFYATGIGAGVE